MSTHRFATFLIRGRGSPPDARSVRSSQPEAMRPRATPRWRSARRAFMLSSAPEIARARVLSFRPMEPRRFIMNAGRTTKQGQQINIGKDSPEYQAIVGTVTMHGDDLK